MDYPEYEQYPTCPYCGDSHWGYQCHERNSYPPYPQNAYAMNSNHRYYHRNTQHSFNFNSGHYFTPNYYSNNFCRHNRETSYQAPEHTHSMNYYKKWPTKWEYSGDDQWSRCQHQPQVQEQKEPTLEELLQNFIKNSEVSSKRVDTSMRNIEAHLARLRELSTKQKLEHKGEANMENNTTTEKGTDKGGNEEDPNKELWEPAELIEEHYKEEYLYEKTQDPVELPYEKDEHIEIDTPLDAGTRDKEWEESMMQLEEVKDLNKEFNEPPKKDTKVQMIHEDPLVDNIVERRKIEQNEEVRVQQPGLELQEHKGSLFCPLLNFDTLSLCFESINFDPPYILHVIAYDFNCCWEMGGYEFLRICLMSKLNQTDARSKCRDITFPFDRG